MKRREWSVTADEVSHGQAGQPSAASTVLRPGRGIEYVLRLVFELIFFGAIGLLFSSWFPVALGLFFFFTNDEFIEWALWRVRIRLVPDTLGPEFIKAFVFLLGLWALLAYWKDAAPAWLSPWLPPDASWYFIAGAALGCASLKIISVAIVKKLLPRVGIGIAPGRQSAAILAVLG